MRPFRLTSLCERTLIRLMNRKMAALSLLVLCLVGGIAEARVTIPQKLGQTAVAQAPYSSTGLVETQIGRSYYRGSGAVARDPRLVFSCAHTAFDRGRWADVVRIAVAYNGASDALPSRYTALRGYRVFSSYASNVSQFGDDSDQAFNTDFLVGFHTDALGPVVSAHADGAPFLLNGGVQKMIVGYPAVRDFDGADGGFFMHRTGPFSHAFTREFDAYLGVQSVSTGEGNSGGPVFEMSGGTPILAGVLVSGTRRSAGVYAIDGPAWELSNNALTALGETPPPTSSTKNPGSSGPYGDEFDPPTVDELVIMRTMLQQRLVQIRSIRNPQARAIQLRRVRAMIRQINFQIMVIS